MNVKALCLVSLASIVLAACTGSVSVEGEAPPVVAVPAASDPPAQGEGGGSGGSSSNGKAMACTMDAKQCPDGSYVGRDSANNCRFKACPGEQN